ncbi:hypothetical protein JR316_0009485 [Psilocybe cubensis]|uniref:Uncharacterized protein n=1 Tax=Psilocybe cubensis TaxID=181762 RepID=A0ACB8GPX6_PSICU|nr:hypothetical protein JR316_0009485 [Psilocybe cubensis]KAH9477281.1 hypothetical protein JR316_0009485 [Psilocybe cubensis]
MPKIAERNIKVSEDFESQKQLHRPMLASVEQHVSYYRSGRHDNLPGNLTSISHSNTGEMRTSSTRSMQMDLNCEGSSGVDPVEPFARLVHRDGGMVDRPSTTKGGKRRESASTAKRPRTGPLQDPAQTNEGEGRVAATLTAAVRPQLRPERPRCLSDGFSQGRLVIDKRERHRKKEGGVTFQVMRPTQGP